jgi:hypothetical protein
MFKIYILQNVFNNLLKELSGVLFLIILLFFVVVLPQNLGIKSDLSFNIMDDFFIAIAFFVLLYIFGIIVIFGRLIFFTCYYAKFNDNGISILKSRKELYFIEWANINMISFEIIDNFLTISVEYSNNQYLKFHLIDLWLLSYRSQKCVNYNSFKLLSIIHQNKNLMNNIDKNQIENLYEYSQVLRPCWCYHQQAKRSRHRKGVVASKQV